MSDTQSINVSTEIAQALSAATEWRTATVSTLAEVEELFNQAERDGYREHELTVLGPNVYYVRWR